MKKYTSCLRLLICFSIIMALTINNGFAQFTIHRGLQSFNSDLNLSQTNLFSITNGSSVAQKVNIEVHIRSVEMEVYSQSCNQVLIDPGLTLSTAFNCIENFYSFSKSIFPGNYLLSCVILNGEENNKVLSSSEWNITIDPIMLIPMIPLEKQMEGVPLLFCYGGPSLNSNATTTITIWENSQDLQSTNHTIEQPPFYEFNSIGFCTEYPLNAPKLKENTKYFWQIKNFNTGIEVGRSSIVNFEIGKEEKDSMLYDYRLVNTKVNNGKYVYGSVLKFSFQNRYNERKLKYNILDLTNGKKLKNVPSLKLESGLNLIDIETKGIAGINYGNMYRLEITDLNNDKYNILFSIDRLK